MHMDRYIVCAYSVRFDLKSSVMLVRFSTNLFALFLIIDSFDLRIDNTDISHFLINVRNNIFDRYAMSSNKNYTLQKEIIKPTVDERDYKLITLSNNKLDILLISDPSSDKASAAMDVHVGHLNDPTEFPGLAHFCEHLLFMGTQKYPLENEYSAHLTSHGGHSNAYTGVQNTNYYFEVHADHLRNTLDRFAQFFIHPLFNESGTERELLAVDSEYFPIYPSFDHLTCFHFK